MREVILDGKIVDLAAVARGVLRDDAQSRKLAVALQPLPAHDERAHDRLAHAGQLRERLPELVGGHFQNLAFLRFASRAGQRRRAHEHRYITDEIAWTG